MIKQVTNDLDLQLEAETPEIKSNAFFFRIQDNGTHDNFKLLEYC